MTNQLMAFLSAKRNRLKVYQNNKIYLKSNSEFEIELYNPRQNNVLAMIYINDNLISTSGIVIKPGQRIYLDRYLDTPNKFKFSTYEVEDNESNNQAIKNNGKVKVIFYDEKKYYPNYNCTISTSDWWNGITTTGDWGVPTTTTNAYYCSTDYNISSCNSNGFVTSATYSEKNPDKETGRIEKGGKSNQKFESVNMQFESLSFLTVEYQILPESQKLITSQDIKTYCPICRYRIRKETWVYCPKCGEKL